MASLVMWIHITWILFHEVKYEIGCIWRSKHDEIRWFRVITNERSLMYLTNQLQYFRHVVSIPIPCEKTRELSVDKKSTHLHGTDTSRSTALLMKCDTFLMFESYHTRNIQKTVNYIWKLRFSWLYGWRCCPSGLLHRKDSQINTNVSERYFVFIFRAEITTLRSKYINIYIILEEVKSFHFSPSLR